MTMFEQTVADYPMMAACVKVTRSCGPIDRSSQVCFSTQKQGTVWPMHVRVQKWGNSLAVRIPKPLAEDAEVREGTVLNLAVSEGRVVATPVQKKQFSLKQLLAKVTKRNLHAEVDFGSPVGRETW